MSRAWFWKLRGNVNPVRVSSHKTKLNASFFPEGVWKFITQNIAHFFPIIYFSKTVFAESYSWNFHQGYLQNYFLMFLQKYLPGFLPEVFRICLQSLSLDSSRKNHHKFLHSSFRKFSRGFSGIAYQQLLSGFMRDSCRSSSRNFFRRVYLYFVWNF